LDLDAVKHGWLIATGEVLELFALRPVNIVVSA
jgi:hypothetical protein